MTCEHQQTEIVRLIQRSGSWSYVERCADCLENVGPLMTQRVAAARVLDQVREVPAYRPNPDLAEPCWVQGCAVQATVAHHPIRGEDVTIWLCPIHHRRAHGPGKGHEGRR